MLEISGSDISQFATPSSALVEQCTRCQFRNLLFFTEIEQGKGFCWNVPGEVFGWGEGGEAGRSVTGLVCAGPVFACHALIPQSGGDWAKPVFSFLIGV